MNPLFRHDKLTRLQLQEYIESAHGHLAGFELLSEGRGPWVWVDPVCANTYRAPGPNVEWCRIAGSCSAEDEKAFSYLLGRGDIILRVIYVRRRGESRFAVLRID